MNKLVKPFISISILFILLSALLYLVPTYSSHYTSAASFSEDLTATFIVSGENHELEKNEIFILGSRTAKILEIESEGVLLETRGKELVILEGESLEINGNSIELLKIR